MNNKKQPKPSSKKHIDSIRNIPPKPIQKEYEQRVSSLEEKKVVEESTATNNEKMCMIPNGNNNQKTTEDKKLLSTKKAPLRPNQKAPVRPAPNPPKSSVLIRKPPVAASIHQIYNIQNSKAAKIKGSSKMDHTTIKIDDEKEKSQNVSVLNTKKENKDAYYKKIGKYLKKTITKENMQTKSAPVSFIVGINALIATIATLGAIGRSKKYALTYEVNNFLFKANICIFVLYNFTEFMETRSKHFYRNIFGTLQIICVIWMGSCLILTHFFDINSIWDFIKTVFTSFFLWIGGLLKNALLSN